MRALGRVATTTAIVMLSALGPAGARAQSPNELAAARRLYQQGTAHAQAGRWEDARSAFEQSLALAERPATLLNLAGALVETGRLVAGSEAYRRYLQIAGTDRHRADAERLLAELDGRIPRIVVRAALRDGDVLVLDGEELSRAILGAELPVDPGRHALVVTREGERVGSAEVELREGEHREVAIEVAAPRAAPVDLGLAPAPAPTPEPRDEDGGGVLSSPWFWIVAGVILVGAAAGITVGLVASDTGPGPYTGNIGSGRLGVP